MSKIRNEFFKQIEELALTQQYDKEVVRKLVNISDVSKILSRQEKRDEVRNTLIHIDIVAKSLADKIQVFKDK